METTIRPAAPSGDVLCMKTLPTFENDRYDIPADIRYTLWTGEVTPEPGDVLEYDRLLKVLPDRIRFAFLCIDSRGEGHLLGDSDRETGFWRHCEISLDSLAGLTLREIKLICLTEDLTRGSWAFFDNICLSGSRKTEIYKDGRPPILYEADVKGYYMGVLTAMPLNAPEGDVLNVRDFGALGDGNTDDTQAFQAALFAAQGRSVLAPAGSYRIAAHLIIPDGGSLRGQGDSTLLLAEESRDLFHGPAFITTEGTAVLSDFAVAYPGQGCDCVLPYPWTIRSEFGRSCRFENLTLYNSYNAIKLGTSENVGQVLRNIRITALHQGLLADCSKNLTVECLTVSPDVWTESSLFPGSEEDVRAVEAYLCEMLDAVAIGACPDCRMENIQISHARSGLQFAESTQVSMWTPLRLKAPKAGSGILRQLQLDHVNWGLELNYLMGALTVEGGFIHADGPSFPLALRVSKDISFPVTLRDMELSSTGGCLEQIGPKARTALERCTFADWNPHYHCIDVEHGTIFLKQTVCRNEAAPVILRTPDAVCQIH